MAIKDEYFVIVPNFYETSMLVYNEIYYKDNNSDISSINLTSAAYVHNPIKLTIDKAQKDPVLADFMYCHSVHLILHVKLLDFLLSLKLPKTQHFPVHIKDRKGVVHKDYFMWYIYNEIACLDPDKSDADKEPGGGYDIFEIVLDNKKISNIKLENRVIFRLSESPSIRLIHKNLVKKLIQMHPTGVKFYPVEKWHAGILE